MGQHGAPTNGLLVQGSVGIGISTPLQKLHLKDAGITLEYNAAYALNIFVLSIQRNTWL